MNLQTFHNIMYTWYVIFFAVLIFCSVNAIIAVKKQNNRFLLSYVPEAITILVNLTFMYIINGRYIDYGNSKFSGLDSLGDWLGFAVLLALTAVSVILTVVCHIIYGVKKRKCRGNFM